MKTGTHPKYDTIQVTCSCGNMFETRSAVDQAAAHRGVLGLPPVLHGQAEGDGHRGPDRQVPPALRRQAGAPRSGARREARAREAGGQVGRLGALVIV